MSYLLKGTGISMGIGIGKAIVLKNYDINIPDHKIKNIDAEITKLQAAIKNIITELESINEQTDIVDAYIMLLKDPNVIDEIKKLIQKEKLNVAAAVNNGLSMIADVFNAMDDEYMKERANDISDIKTQLLVELLNIPKHNLKNLEPESILVANCINLSELLDINFKNLSGIITECGGKNAHISIVARNFSVPLVVGIKKITDKIHDGDKIVLDARNGNIYCNPNKEQLEKYTKDKARLSKLKCSLESFKDKPSLTKDGIKFDLMSNVGSYNDVDTALECKADGIGLLRSEFLFSSAKELYSEEKQYEMYRRILIKMDGMPVTIRLFDFGGDKKLTGLSFPKEENPALGCRGIRFDFAHTDILRTQLKAIFRASVYGNLSVLIPMVSTTEEIHKLNKLILDVKKELKNICISFKENIKIGIMIEVPSAAIMCDKFAPLCDFFSIGTNDLIQYVMATDRSNKNVDYLYSHYHPAILRMIKNIADIAEKNNISCSVCGELASDQYMIPILLGLGVKEISVAPGKLLAIRNFLSKISVPDAQKLGNAVLNLSTSQQVLNFLKHNCKKHGPKIDPIFISPQGNSLT